MPTKKKTAKKRTTKKKRVVKTEAGRSLREARAKELAGSSSWPWKLRPYQQRAEDAWQKGTKRFGLFWHRRAGKDVFCISKAQEQMRKRIGGYVHFFPKHVQAKRALWNGIDPKKGARFIDIAFGDIESDRNNTEMLIESYNGSTWQLLGSDNYDRIVGSNAVGVFFSEWALCDPRAWDFIRPIILENDGFAVFITTFRGRNHAWQMAQRLKNNPDWYIDIMGVDESTDVDGNPIITPEMIQEERDSGMTEALIQQEYYCNPEAVADGAIYGKQVEQLRLDEPRQRATWNPNKPVYCVWNIDFPIYASFIIAQPGLNPIVLDSKSFEFTTLGEVLSKAEQYRFPIQQHIIRGDQRELVTQFSDLNRTPLVYDVNRGPGATIATSNFIERCLIDGPKCELLLDALSGFVRREHFDAQVADMQYSDYAVHSWHWQLVGALEAFAAWEYYSGGEGWGRAPDYRNSDRISKTLL